ncbi:DUF3014 domain-containing protein [Exilibacterium tricleocarpae]|uniref:DUF3014 domain-containing protein n=1 Tax=Exilibacterium tricleocarpae TaxID=2591008 RepID=A0A545T0L9_9GAMM|nr:DUF3014 domain-containing protein [Exilibacterium tricleocarpae]TQV70741.1 DUF3014 domain-containing protein [Exilibacterium tricleocarpae]
MNQYNEEAAPPRLPGPAVYIAAGMLVVLLVGVGFYFWSSQRDRESEILDTTAVAPPVDTAPEPQVELDSQQETPPPPSFAEQAEAEAQAEPPVELPPLNNSDERARELAAGLSPNLPDWLVPDELIRKFVLAVNVTSRGELSRKYPPIVPPKQAFVATKVTGNTFTMPAASYRRYDPYVALLGAINMQDVAVLYRQYYPLLQAAHEELAQTKAGFHATLLRAIDNLLTAPEIDGELPLVRTSVLYQYADPDLEKLPATHKLLLRMGAENTRELKRALRELRTALTP